MPIDYLPPAPEQTPYLETFSDNDADNVQNITRMIWSELNNDGTSSILSAARGVIPGGFEITANTGTPQYTLDIAAGVVTVSDMVVEVGASTGLNVTNNWSSWAYTGSVGVVRTVVIVLKYVDQSSNPVEIGIQPYLYSLSTWYQDNMNDPNVITLGFADYTWTGTVGELDNIRYSTEESGTRISRTYPVTNDIIDGGTISEPDPE